MNGNGQALPLAQLWAAQLGEALLNLTGEKPAIECRPGAADSEAGVRWSRFDFSIAAEASLWVGTAEAACQEIGQRARKRAGVEPDGAGDLQNTYLEVLSQCNGPLVAILTQTLRSEVSCRPGAEPAGTPPPSGLHRVEVAFAGAAPLALCVGFSPRLLEAAAPAAAPPAADPVPDTAPAASEGATLGLTSKTLDVLLDVEVPVRVSFGSAHVRIQEILKLTTGSIVELDRSISEPVEVVVNNCVIARGEVVVVEGNYGVRIQEIASRSERLRTSNVSLGSLRAAETT